MELPDCCNACNNSIFHIYNLFSFLDEEKVLGYTRNNENASEAEIIRSA